MTSGSEPVGTLQVALAHAERLLATQPLLAIEQAREILAVVPGHPAATLILGAGLRESQRANDAIEVLQPLAAAQPRWAAAQRELGLAFGEAGRGEDAVKALRVAVRLQPALADAWRALGDHLHAMGDTDGADAAYAQHVRASTRDPKLLEPALALAENRLAVAEPQLRAHLRKHPTDVVAIRMLAEVAGRLGRYVDARHLLERCLELAPNFHAARYNFATVLHRDNLSIEALAELDKLLAHTPQSPSYRALKAAVLSRIGEYGQALQLYRRLIKEYPHQARVWLSYGHALKTDGDVEESIVAYRKAIELEPTFGEAYWSLANLKTFRFEPADLEAMRNQLGTDGLQDEDRLHFEFALGKALEDARDYEASFRHYAEGNRLRKKSVPYNAGVTHEQVDRSRTLYTREFFEARAGSGSDARDPIFIVSPPRSGSTLLEQILSSHSAVEGTMELPDVISIVKGLTRGTHRDDVPRYPEVLATLEIARFGELGERYLEQTRIQRKTSAPYFVDKMPNNWIHVGFIHLMLPNAKIIDARRHPMSCCFSNFKQHFARGQNFSYSLEDMASYYKDYVAMMAHIDRVLPGRVHRVVYEHMVADTEGEIRRLLDYCGLPFEDSCLRFYENDRAVRTASSEQVRRPINREGIDQWRHFEPWLAPLRDALGPVLEVYPDVPATL